jgi:hypothetical protein
MILKFGKILKTPNINTLEFIQFLGYNYLVQVRLVVVRSIFLLFGYVRLGKDTFLYVGLGGYGRGKLLMLGYIRLGKVTLGWVIREGLDKLNFRVVE